MSRDGTWRLLPPTAPNSPPTIGSDAHGGLGWPARPRYASAAAAGRVVAGGFAGQAAAADHEFTLELRFVGLVGRLLLLPLVLRSNPVILLGRRNIERAGDFPLRSRLLLWPKLKRLGFLRRGRAKPVPCDRAPGGCATASRRAAIGEHQHGDEERDAFRNHRNGLTVRQLKTRLVMADASTPASPHLRHRSDSKAEQRQAGPAKCKY
jgi:hypothetical protein